MLPESLVISENTGMMLTDITVEKNIAVAEPKAEVKAVKSALNNNQVIVGGGYIRPFYM